MPTKKVEPVMMSANNFVFPESGNKSNFDLDLFGGFLQLVFMTRHLLTVVAAIVCLGTIPAFSQLGQMPGGPQLDAATAKLFGENTAFSATSETQMKSKSGDVMTLPAKMSFDAGKTRFEMNMAEMKGAQLPANAAAQMKSMGMDQMVMIARPDKKTSYLVYPGLQSYAEMPLKDADSAVTNANFKIETAELGKETVDGHPCVKNKVVVTDDKGLPHESTVWNATDMKNFPIKIAHNEAGNEVTMTFKDTTLAKPDASLFEPPAGYTRYADIQTMMRTEMMKHMGGGMGMPPGR